MQREISLHSTAAPDVVLQRLRDLAAHLPPGSRYRPSHVTAIQIQLVPPRFSVQCIRTYRDYSGPFCDGRVLAGGTGSIIQGTLRRRWGFFFAPLLALPFVVYSWLQGSIGVGGMAMMLVLLAVLAGWLALVSLFSSDRHEAEADALLALLARAADPESDAQAGA